MKAYWFAAVVSLSAIRVEAQPSWSATNSMATARNSFTATLLTNGKVLVAGGANGVSSELYDPATGQWSATGNLGVQRSIHIGVRLLNGKVLIAGGLGANVTRLSSAELYDPETGSWSPTGSLSVARQSPAAVRLTDGRVIVVGGSTTAGASDTAEIYDPATGAWSPAGTMSVRRASTGVALLPNGKVLVAGGQSLVAGADSSNRTAEIYDPGTNTWTLTGELVTPRPVVNAVALANGTVLIAGGVAADGFPTSNCEIYNPVTGRWSATGNLPGVRFVHTLTLLPHGHVLAAGGSTEGFVGFLKTAALYDPVAGTWRATPELAGGRYNHAASLLANGKVLTIGGAAANAAGTAVTVLSTAEVFDSAFALATSVSAASFTAGGAPEAIAAAFGADFATGTEVTAGATQVLGVSVRVRDSAGAERTAPLFLVSPAQINYLIPAGTAIGLAFVTVVSGGGVIAAGTIEIAGVAPSLFTANSTGQGLPAAQVFRRRSSGAESVEAVATYDSAQNRFVAVPVDTGAEGDAVFLILYGTGIRFRSDLANIRVMIGGVESEVIYAGAAPGFIGLDQVNARIGRALAGRGDVDVVLTVDAKPANRVRITIR